MLTLIILYMLFPSKRVFVFCFYKNKKKIAIAWILTGALLKAGIKPWLLGYLNVVSPLASWNILLTHGWLLGRSIFVPHCTRTHILDRRDSTPARWQQMSHYSLSVRPFSCPASPHLCPAEPYHIAPLCQRSYQWTYFWYFCLINRLYFFLMVLDYRTVKHIVQRVYIYPTLASQFALLLTSYISMVHLLQLMNNIDTVILTKVHTFLILP